MAQASIQSAQNRSKLYDRTGIPILTGTFAFKLTVSTLKKEDKDYRNNLKHLAILKKYNPNGLSDIQKITQKIAVFETENNIDRFENFRFHSHPFNQISGNHLNLVEFMTDTHVHID